MFMNLTLSADAKVVEKARLVAQRQGTSLNALIRQYLRSLAGDTAGVVAAKELLSLMTEYGGYSDGQHFKREDIYLSRLKKR
jgi:hypothetical protein